MNLIYYDLYQATRLEKFVTGMIQLTIDVNQSSILFQAHDYIICSRIAAYAEFLKANGEQPVTWKRAASMEEVLREADVV